MRLFRADVNKQQNKNKVVKNPNWQEGDQLAILQSAAKELNSGQLRTNPASSRVKGLNPVPPD